MAKKKASPVSRSVYQKLAEENKRLKNDLKNICHNVLSAEAIQARMKWKKHFENEALFARQMKEIATEYFKQNPKP